MVEGRLIYPLAIAIALLAPAAAAAKGVSAAKVCGAVECVKVTDDELALRLAGGGPSVSGPERRWPWYRTTLTVTVRDPQAAAPADRERAVQRFSIAAVPRVRLERAEDGGWMRMSPRSATAYAELIAGIDARPARTLGDLGADAALPDPRVNEVVDSLPATGPEASGDASPGWIAWLIGGLLATGVLALLARAERLRRRRGVAA